MRNNQIVTCENEKDQTVLFETNGDGERSTCAMNPRLPFETQNVANVATNSHTKWRQKSGNANLSIGWLAGWSIWTDLQNRLDAPNEDDYDYSRNRDPNRKPSDDTTNNQIAIFVFYRFIASEKDLDLHCEMFAFQHFYDHIFAFDKWK